MKTCLLCGKTIPTRIKIDGKNRNLCSRKYCFDCSPWGKKNNRKLHAKPCLHSRKYSTMTQEEKGLYNKKIAAYQKDRRKKRKAILILEKGGKCEICGYDKNLSCLDFHHVDPTKKSFEITSREIYAKPMNILREETAKCKILCCRCHREYHHPNFVDWKENINYSVLSPNMPKILWWSRNLGN